MKLEKIIEEVNYGKKARRKGWNDKEMCIFDFSINNFCIKDREGLDKFLGRTSFFIEDGYIRFEDDNGNFYKIDNFLVLKTSGDTNIPWKASQADILADDWEFVE